MTQEKYADKIAKLLAKAQSTTPEEAESLTAKAMELMHRYAIDEAMIDAARGVDAKDEIGEDKWEYTGTYRMAAWRLANTVARAFGCTTLLSDDSTGRKAQLYVIGFESDRRKAREIETSLQIQMARALNAWYKTDGRDWWDRNQKFAERRQFMFSFAEGVGTKLRVARTAAEASAQEESAAGGTSVALVLRSRKERVDEWVDKSYGRLRTGASRSYKGGGSSTRNAGFNAGRSADVGQSRIGGRKALRS